MNAANTTRTAVQPVGANIPFAVGMTSSIIWRCKNPFRHPVIPQTNLNWTTERLTKSDSTAFRSKGNFSSRFFCILFRISPLGKYANTAAFIALLKPFATIVVKLARSLCFETCRHRKSKRETSAWKKFTKNCCLGRNQLTSYNLSDSSKIFQQEESLYLWNYYTNQTPKISEST